MVCKKVTYTGRVQGVGFRYQSTYLAQFFKIRGYVKNLATGDVELVCEGEEDQVEEFLSQVATHLKRYIKEINAVEVESQNYTSFKIEY